MEEKTYPSTKEIIAYIKLTYVVSYIQQGMHDWLSHHRFSHKKPKGIPAKFNAARQDSFIKKYDELKASLGVNKMIFLWTEFIQHRKQKLLMAGPEQA